MEQQYKRSQVVVEFDFDETGHITKNHVERTKAKTLNEVRPAPSRVSVRRQATGRPLPRSVS
jgi:hypothetical protein